MICINYSELDQQFQLLMIMITRINQHDRLCYSFVLYFMIQFVETNSIVQHIFFTNKIYFLRFRMVTSVIDGEISTDQGGSSHVC